MPFLEKAAAVVGFGGRTSFPRTQAVRARRKNACAKRTERKGLALIGIKRIIELPKDEEMPSRIEVEIKDIEGVVIYFD
ncbi:MAG: hypothetical protein NPINA01_19920 [Nitrospinaceae bacterium]|nr:MAG: hypothetical protein NPINA01_19920 [Nitrospinaceae bacterium]